MPDKVILTPWQQTWADTYGKEKNLILDYLSEYIIHIHHIGSTAIKGIAAKPVIDITIESSVYPPEEKIIQTLTQLGYRHEGEATVPGRHWFIKGTPATHHLHWCPCNGDVVKRQCLFRDKLNTDHNLARQYETLKQNLAKQFPNNLDQYTQGKNSFVEKVLSERP